MLRPLAWIACVCFLAAPSPAPAAPEPRPMRVYKVNLGGEMRETAVADVSGDGRRDLVISHGAGDDRRISIARQTATGGFPSKPDQTLTPPPEAVAFIVADLAATPGDELALLCTDGVRIYPRTGDTFAAQPVRLLAAAGFVDVAPRGALVRWQGVHDLDGDGLPDLLVPQRAGYLCVFQGADRSFSLLQVLPVEPEERVITRSFYLLDFDFAGSVRMLPQLLPADFDGDGHTDLLTLRRARLTGFLQQPGRRYAATPSFDAELASLRPRIAAGTADEFERKRASFADLDGDPQADLVVISTEGTIGLFSSITTAVAVFRGRKGALFAARPDQALLLPGAPVRTQIADLTNDGRPDLLAVTVRTDLLGAALAGGVSLTTRLYRGTAGGFDPVPILEDTVKVSATTVDQGQRVALGYHGADLTGDGLPDRADWTAEGSVAITRSRPDADGRLTLETDVPWAQASMPSGALQVWAAPVTHATTADVLIRWPKAVGVAFPEGRR